VSGLLFLGGWKNVRHLVGAGGQSALAGQHRTDGIPVASMSAAMTRIMGPGFLRTVTRDDLSEGYEGLLSDGWVVVDDAVLLSGWLESYYGRRAGFARTMSYELAVNGRGIEDLDLTEGGEARIPRLLRRGVAFAWAALHVQHRQLPEVRMTAWVSAAPVLMEPDRFTGYVTFFATRPGEPVADDPTRYADEIVIALFTEDCRQPLLPGQ
jgi:hypothetical protein